MPLSAQTEEKEYLQKFDDQVIPAVERFLEDHKGLIIISCGFDACVGDSPAHKGGFLHLTSATFGEITKRISKLSADHWAGLFRSLRVATLARWKMAATGLWCSRSERILCS